MRSWPRSKRTRALPTSWLRAACNRPADQRSVGIRYPLFMTVVAPGDALQQSDSRHNDGLSGGPPRFFGFVQLPSGTVLAGSCTRGMSRSLDGGRTWTPIDALADLSEHAFALGG